MEWFTADYHLSHSNIIKYVKRPFENVSMMDEVILANLELQVEKNDILYYLGDLTFKEEIARSFFERFDYLKIHYIIGNHDNNKIIDIARKFCNSISNLKDIKISNRNITLCHYAMRVWNKSHLNSWQLYGHSHGDLDPIGKQYDVGVDSNDFKPLSFEEIEDIIKKAPNNLNYIPIEQRTAIR
ncbi:MAG: phosphoesterase [Candidatus Lokiarchaeota archaeon]|nr:phosphoesterase [Candidatus Lokiarchaeota archaeon]MBD3202258.1 phosphoesterase [Candidatus Lokiarchaeota archaeon]